MPLKENVKNIFKINRRTFLYPTGWLGLNLLKSQHQTTVDMAKSIFTPVPEGRKETFSQAMARLKLTDDDLKRLWLQFVLYALVFVLFGCVALLYGIYLLIKHASLAGLVLSLAASGLFFVHAFRFHFLSFQIRQRKLGCTFDEYLNGKTNSPDRSGR